jgi:hypothetical protein
MGRGVQLLHEKNKLYLMDRSYQFSGWINKHHLPVIVTLPRSFVTALLASVFSLAFIITDYWNIPNDRILVSMILIGSIISGFLWCFLAGANLKIVFDFKS